MVSRVNVSISPEILKLIDTECQRTGESRSTMIRRAVVQYLEAQKAMRELPRMNQMLDQLQDILKDPRISASDLKDMTLPQKSKKQ